MNEMTEGANRPPARPAGSDRGEAVPSERQGAARGADDSRGEFVQRDKQFYYRDKQDTVAFEDTGARLATKNNDVAVARAMVDMAVEKDWKTITVSGADEFKRGVWLEAAARDVPVAGYKPTDVDMALLQERQERQERASKERAPGAPEAGERGSRAEGAPGWVAADRDAVDTPAKVAARAEEQRELTAKQQLAMDALKSLMGGRGDSDKAMEMAMKLMTDLFQKLEKEDEKSRRGDPVVNRYDRDAESRTQVELAQRDTSFNRDPDAQLERQAPRPADRSR
ncbi:LPD7 domain-containing protein [Massilia sp. CCM 9210]|uniref:LPD7 domain-containing protein n=1 Tax=Massilia scottii TaxID=3057166 RepID=UPI0027966BA4|nr:LPD7 domain-containing protein [Massilia sp. CCM 9210]MDQ1815794.1 LPD7 domain-containing protein [Massilia sp. CCM 9210]